MFVTGYLMVVLGHEGEGAPALGSHCVTTSASNLASPGQWKKPCGETDMTATVSPIPVTLTTALSVLKEKVAYFVKAMSIMKTKYVRIFHT
jgi:hypothetical protein